MPKRSSTPKDQNQLAASVVAQTTGDAPPAISPKPTKNPAAVAMGKLGGKGKSSPDCKTVRAGKARNCHKSGRGMLDEGKIVRQSGKNVPQ